MPTPILSASALIPAPAVTVYALFADYEQAHPQLLPPTLFSGLTLTRGGYGAGTEYDLTTTLWGRSHTAHAVVSEPEPGRVLAERMDNGYLTTFTVEPRGDDQCHVTIATEISDRTGLAARLEAWLIARLFRAPYQEELRRLEAMVQQG